MVRKRATKTGAATKAKHNKAAIMVKIEANIRRKVKTYLAKHKRGRSHSSYNNKAEEKQK
jgi:hypothetical protein